MTDEELRKSLLMSNPLEQKQISYFFPRWISQKSKEKFLKNLPQLDLEFMFQLLPLLNITQFELESYEPSKVVNSLVNEIMQGHDEMLDDLQKVFSNNSERVIKEYLEMIKSFQINMLPKKTRDSIGKLMECGKDDRVEVILSNQRDKNDKVCQIEEGMQQFQKALKLFDVHVFTCNALSKNPHIVQRLKYAIDTPLFLMPVNVDVILNRKKLSISQWYLYRKLSIPEYKEFVTKLDDQQQWQKMYSDAVRSIQQKLDIPIPAIVKRKELIESLFYNCKKKYYGSALIIVFPIIEGLLWDLSRQIEIKEEVLGTESKELIDSETNESFFSDRIRDVIERTVVNKILDSDFIKEFCEELYEERNPVLHGNSICQHDCDNIGVCFIKKLFVLDYLINIFESVFEKQLFDLWDSAFTPDKMEEFITKFCN